MQLSQVDVSTATGEVKVLQTPASLLNASVSLAFKDTSRDVIPGSASLTGRSTSRFSVQLPSLAPTSPTGGGSITSIMHDSLGDDHDFESTGSASASVTGAGAGPGSSTSSSTTRERKGRGYVVPLPRTYNKTTPYTPYSEKRRDRK